MDWLERMNGAIDYIEDHLEGHIDYEELARIAVCSVYQFQRMFSFVLGIPLSEYIRRRRLTLAAFDLQDKRKRVTDIALRYGYETPESFSRAFHTLHGLTPTAARDAGRRLTAYPRISFQLTLQGVEGMNYRIEKREAFQVFGVEDIYSMDSFTNANGLTIPEVWHKHMADGQYERLTQRVAEDWHSEGGFNPELGMVLAYDSYRFTSNTSFPYLIGCYKSSACNADDYTVVEVPAATWAVFSTLGDGRGSGTYDLHSLRHKIFAEWLPTSNYSILDGGNFEMYGTAQDGYEYCELWFRIEEKA